ncbi:MAG: 30S ribosomal protein THX [Oligoflexia bacterium]|nr:30S ribosomal protein THX [Oligoflexia bacterium]
MGKGDKRTRRGKIFAASFGKSRRTAKAKRAMKRAAAKGGKAKKSK